MFSEADALAQAMIMRDMLSEACHGRVHHFGYADVGLTVATHSIKVIGLRVQGLGNEGGINAPLLDLVVVFGWFCRLRAALSASKP